MRLLLMVLVLAGCSVDENSPNKVPEGTVIECRGQLVCDPGRTCYCGGVARPELDAGGGGPA